MLRKCHPEQGLAMRPCGKIRKGALGEVLTGKGVESRTRLFVIVLLCCLFLSYLGNYSFVNNQECVNELLLTESS